MEGPIYLGWCAFVAINGAVVSVNEVVDPLAHMFEDDELVEILFQVVPELE